MKFLRYSCSGLAIILGFITIVASSTPPAVIPPPTSIEIFEPDPNHNFGANTGSVTINSLSGCDAVCYTLDGSAPQYNGGECSGGTTQSLVGNEINIDCGSSTSSSTLTQIKLAFDWTDFPEQASGATFILDCTLPPPDGDGDGWPDVDDNCPGVYNEDQADTDGDGIGDACEGVEIEDMDGDTRQDDFDNCVDVWNFDQGDDDSDGIGNVCDTEPQGPAPELWANDDFAAAFVRWKDKVQYDIRPTDPTGGGDQGTITCDNGGAANWNVQLDIFGGKADSYFTYTNCEYTSAEGDHLIIHGQIVQYSDFDGNGTERTPSGALSVTGGDYIGTVKAFTEFHNRTRDGGYYTVSCTSDPIAGEICAPNSLETNHYYPDWACAEGICPVAVPPLVDSDGDGVFDIYDNCPVVQNADQANADFDSEGDECDSSTGDTTDSDSDGIPDVIDNCPDDSNVDQEDDDNDGIGNECDLVFNPDGDGDTIPDDLDNCPDNANTGQEDDDGDGDGNACDDTPRGHDNDNDGIPFMDDNCPDVSNNSQADSDNDGIGNACDDDPGFVQIFFNVGTEPGRCLKTQDADIWGSETKSGTGCATTNDKNNWEIMDVDGAPSAVKMFKNLDSGECMEYFDIALWPNIRMSGCDTGNDAQHWTVERYNDNFDFRFPSRLHSVAANFCIYTNSTGDTFGTYGNCDLAGTEDNRQVGIYFGGDFFGSEPYEP